MPPTVKPDWNKWDAIDQRTAALDELQNPSGAYDGPIRKAGHQFDHLFRDIDADPTFPSAGAPPGVNDAMNNNRRNNNLAVRGQDQDPDPDEPNSSVPSAEECANFIQILLDGLAAQDQQNGGETGEHQKLMQYLAALLHRAHQQNNGGNSDQMTTAPSSALPMSYSSNARFARQNTSASDRRIAQDAMTRSTIRDLNNAAFLRRWGPQVGKIRLTGNGR
jgi:hypothetical protein